MGRQSDPHGDDREDGNDHSQLVSIAESWVTLLYVRTFSVQDRLMRPRDCTLGFHGR